LFLGVLFVVADMYINIAKPVKEHTLLHIGLFAIHMAVWCLFSTHVIELFYPGASQSVQYISCVTLFLIPYQTLYFVRSTFNIKKDFSIKLASSVILLLYIIATILQLTGIADYHETLKLTHLALGIGMFTLVYTLTSTHLHGGISLFKRRKEKNRLGFMIMTIFIIGFLIIGVIFDLILFYNGEQTNVGIFTRYSVIFVIIYLGLLASHNLFDIIKQLNDSELTRKLAYKDNLTNIGNRTAFNRDFEALSNNLGNHEKIALVSFDVNDLKKLNDTKGHAAGDQLIIKASEVISKAFENEFSTVYRIGGDEFVAIIDNKNAEKIYKLGKEIFQTTLEEFNALEEKPFNLSIAYGCAYYDTVGKYTSLDEVLKASDEHMYKHKQVLKSKQTT
jgi:diguanylate cyclase (GGDEF)-like protein